MPPPESPFSEITKDKAQSRLIQILETQTRDNVVSEAVTFSRDIRSALDTLKGAHR